MTFPAPLTLWQVSSQGLLASDTAHESVSGLFFKVQNIENISRTFVLFVLQCSCSHFLRLLACNGYILMS